MPKETITYCQSFHINIDLKSKPNQRLHWSQIAREAREQRQMMRTMLKIHFDFRKINAPKNDIVSVIVELERVYSGRKKRFDDDNYVASLKNIRDEIANWIGIDDGSETYKWVYRQTYSSVPIGQSIFVSITIGYLVDLEDIKQESTMRP